MRRVSSNRSKSLYVWHRSEIGLKFLGSSAGLPGFGMAVTFDFLQMRGIKVLSRHRINNWSNQDTVTGPRCLICSTEMLSTPEALPHLRDFIPEIMSVKVKGLLRWSDEFVQLFNFEFLGRRPGDLPLNVS